MPDRTITTDTGTVITLNGLDGTVYFDHPDVPANLRNTEAGRILYGGFQPTAVAAWAVSPATLRALADLIENAETVTEAEPPDMHQLRIYGASDDLLEVEGYIRDEFDALTPLVLVLTDPTGARLWVTAQFDRPPLQGVGDGWAIGVLHTDTRWRHRVDTTRRAGPGEEDAPEDPALIVHVPAGTTIARWNGDA